jgi:hypothetical protein
VQQSDGPIGAVTRISFQVGNFTAMAITLDTVERRSEPVSPSVRIEAIDALRGVALLGVLAINLVAEFRVSMAMALGCLIASQH